MTLYYRRVPDLVTYWDSARLTVHRLSTGVCQLVSAAEFAVLNLASKWQSRDDLLDGLGESTSATLDEDLELLVRREFVERSDAVSRLSDKLRQWHGWFPVAAFFHLGTHGVPEPNAEAGRRKAERVLVERDYPPALKHYEGAPRFALPDVPLPAVDFGETLLERRTWREFGDTPLTLSQLSALLRHAFGVQQWMMVEEDRWVALKTSPSGGARHSLEAYVIALNVEGLPAGTYHYCPDTHELRDLQKRASRRDIERWLPTQTGFHDPAVLIILSSVFARVQWKYDFPRAYRVILLDAGHIGQTFALAATALGLAPFCTAAVADDKVERHLGLDGVDEAVMFALGVGTRPPKKAWTPNHIRSAPLPPVRPPVWKEAQR